MNELLARDSGADVSPQDSGRISAMRIGIMCHYFHPEIGAPSARLMALARDFTSMGHSVVVITGFPNHPTGIIPPQYRGCLMARETISGIEVLRNWVYATPNEGIVRKILGHLSFMVSSVFFGGPRLRDLDVLIVSSPTFFAVISAWLLSALKGIPYVFEVRDLWPAIFVDLGVFRNRFIIKFLEEIELFLYRCSSAVVTVTESFKENIVSRGIPSGKITTITNGVNIDDFSPGPADADLKRELKIEGKFVALYIGAHGLSQALHAVLRSAQGFKDREDIVYLFVGEGAEKKRLLESAKKWDLRNVRFLDSVPRERVPAFYRLSDLCFVPLRNIPLFNTFIPSKMFEIMSCQKPIIASVRGEARSILERSKAALLVEPEDSEAITEAVLKLRSDADLCRKMGESGRDFVTRFYTRRILSERYLEVLAACRKYSL